jgi:hypothetical protein
MVWTNIDSVSYYTVKRSYSEFYEIKSEKLVAYVKYRPTVVVFLVRYIISCSYKQMALMTSL